MPKILDKKYITDLEGLNEIKSFLDDSIDRFTGQVSSLQEFTQKANADSEHHHERPIGIEVVTIEGEDRGLRIWFADAPNVTTSTSYLSKYLEIENEFSINSLRQRLGIEQSESAEAAQEAQSSKPKPERSVSIDRSPDSSQSENTKPTQPSEADEDDDEDLDETPIVLDVKALKSPSTQPTVPPRSTPEKNSKDKPKNKSKHVNRSEDDIIGDLSSKDDKDDSVSLDEVLASSEAAAETNEDIGEDIIVNLGEDVSLVSELPSEKPLVLDDEDTSPAIEPTAPLESLLEPIQEPDASTLTSYNPYKPNPLEEASNLAHRATTSGEHLSGVNILGAAGQVWALGKAIEQKLVDEIKLRRVEHKESRTWDRAASLDGRLQGIREVKQKQEDQLDNLVDAAEATVERAEDLAERVTIVSDITQREQPQSMAEPSEDLPSYFEDEAESQPRSKNPVPNAVVSPPPEPPEPPEEFLTNIASLGDRVSGMAAELGLKQDKLQPLRFYPDESFNARLTRVERYLEQINQRLDLIEQAVEKLEVELGIRKTGSPVATEAPSVLETKALPTSREEEAFVDRTDWDRFCGEHLLNYADSVNQANGNAPRTSNRSRLAENRVLYLLPEDQDSHIASVAVEDENGNPVYLSTVESTKDGNRWTTDCNELKSEDDQKLIASLPQRSQDYQKQQTAQALVTQLVSKYPDAFSERQESSAKAITVAAGHSTAYRFKVAEVDGQPALLGVEASSDRLALRASCHQQGWRVEQCDIPTEHLNAMMQSDTQKDTRNHAKERHHSKTTEASSRSRKQGRSEHELD